LSQTNSPTDHLTPSELDRLFGDIEADRLPTLPHVLLVLLDASHTEVISFERLSDLIRKDAALSARVVAAASAAYYGGQGKDLTFERTLVLLGLDTIKTIAITASVQQFFSRFDTASSRRLKRFWFNSLTCATIARGLAKLTGYPYGDEAYLAGLIHNIGELIFANNFHQEYLEVLEQVSSLEQQTELERQRFGGDRFQAGAWLISGWNVNPFMADAIMYQSEPVEQVFDAHHLVKIIYLASRLSELAGAPDDQALLVAERLFDLDQSVALDVVEKAVLEVNEAAGAMDIDITAEPAGSESVAPHPLSADEVKQVALADRIRNVALMDGVRQQLARAPNATEVLRTIKQGLNILFSVRVSFFFLFDQEQQMLVGKPIAEQDERIAELEIPLDKKGNSLIMRCFDEKKPLCYAFGSDENIPSVLDKQVMKLAGTRGLLCLPLCIDKNALGVLAVGSDGATKERFTRQRQLYSMFANEAAGYLSMHQQNMLAAQEKTEEERLYYHARAREIVHEVNNPLSIISNYVHILSKKLDQSHMAQEDLAIIREELDRAGNILLRLPGIAERQTTASGEELVNINHLIMDLLKVFRSSLFVTHQIESVTDLDEQMPAIIVDRNALKQVITNIVKNAAEASQGPGRINISTQGLVNLNGAIYVEIVVDDDGPGIPDEIKGKLFTPVETTKGHGHAGLGLTIVKNLLDEMEGSISCRSSARAGTRFEILLPRVLSNE